jgi:serine/threonine protein kinase, bacterial
MNAMEARQITSDPLIGVQLDGRYRVDALIANGGMSAVYRGIDTRLDRPVAIKVMESRYAGDPQFLTRFEREARAVAKLKDPGLVAVYDQGLDGQHPFLVMELVEGGTLRELLRERGPMPPHAVAAVLRPVLSGLAVDFGLVRAFAEAGITSDSVILGTAAYLSPEQVSTGNAGPRSDVYSVGILTYELLTGATPFGGDSALAVAYQRMDNDVRPPSSVIGGVPPQFDEFVACATARDPADRYADAQDMGDELDVIVDELQLPDFRVPAPRNSAEHASAALYRSSAHQPASPPPAPPERNPTLQYSRPDDWAAAEPRGVPGRFAGIELAEFGYQRQRAKRALLLWMAVVLIVTALVAAAAWALGSHIADLI